MPVVPTRSHLSHGAIIFQYKVDATMMGTVLLLTKHPRHSVSMKAEVISCFDSLFAVFRANVLNDSLQSFLALCYLCS